MQYDYLLLIVSLAFKHILKLIYIILLYFGGKCLCFMWHAIQWFMILATKNFNSNQQIVYFP